MVWKLQFSCLQLSGRGGLELGGLGAGLELKCAEVCVCQHASGSALKKLGGSAGTFSSFGHVLNNSHVLLLRGYCQFKNQSCLNIFFLNK